MNTEDSSSSKDHDGEMQQLPGFRFHPTDEELVGFYLRRKVDKKPVVIELIRQIDIYKHDPWDLPKISTAPDKEGYYFCKRGRKYRNSVRPNRVTGSGFWKATGIDKPVYSDRGDGRECIGLKKTLVYYRGSAGKGTKTDWMMQEFRLPPNDDAITTLQEAEVWTVCRVFKRNVSYKKFAPDWKEASSSAKRGSASMKSTSETVMTPDSNNHQECFISFQAPNKPIRALILDDHFNEIRNQQLASEPLSSSNNYNTIVKHSPISMAAAWSPSFDNNPYGNHPDLLAYENWDELRQMVEFAFDPNYHP